MSDTQATLFGADESVGIIRQHTRVKVLVHSHIEASPPVRTGIPGSVDCSADCITLSTSKAIKSGGSASVVLVSRFNYINYIFPNDWINIYIDAR